MEKEESKRRKTSYDNKEAFIIGDHPHEGATAICLGCEHTNVGWGFVFKNINTEEEFFIFKPENLKWKK